MMYVHNAAHIQLIQESIKNIMWFFPINQQIPTIFGDLSIAVVNKKSMWTCVCLIEDARPFEEHQLNSLSSITAVSIDVAAIFEAIHPYINRFYQRTLSTCIQANFSIDYDFNLVWHDNISVLLTVVCVYSSFGFLLFSGRYNCLFYYWFTW